MTRFLIQLTMETMRPTILWTLPLPLSMVPRTLHRVGITAAVAAAQVAARAAVMKRKRSRSATKAGQPTIRLRTLEDSLPVQSAPVSCIESS